MENKMQFKNLYLNRVILEFRYDEGFLYWDKCGETLLDIQRNFPEWKWEGISTELARLKNHTRNMELIFNHKNIRFIQNEVENLNQFKKAAGEITPIIVEKLKIESYKRIGNRYLYILPLENLSEARKIIQKTNFIEVNKEKLSLFGENPIKTAFVINIENKNHSYRIEFVSIERIETPKNIRLNERFNPKYGLRIDVDIAIINPVDAPYFDCTNFIQANKKFLESNLVRFILK